MSLKGLAPMFMALFVIANTGAAFASPPASGKTDTAEMGNLGEALTILHTVGQWSIDVSKMADERAKSDLVKNYARAVATANAETDAKLMEIAKKNGIEVAALDPKTEEGKSLLDRITAETQLSQGRCLRQGIHDPRDQHAAKRQPFSGVAQSSGQGSGRQAIHG